MQKVKDRTESLVAFDSAVRSEFPGCVLVGIDEAGRGPLAGPVVVAGVILTEEAARDYPVFDSKQVSEAERIEMADGLMSDGRVRYALSVKSAARIDEVNILRATHEGMREVALSLGATYALVDGLRVPEFPVAARFVVKGDASSASIAAASILAKTHRDRLLVELDARYPQYGFAKHKGYGTAAHLEALREYGPCPEHRRSFGPVKDILEPPPVQLELF